MNEMEAELTEYASGILSVTPCSATWPIIPVPHGTTISSLRFISSTQESLIHDRNL